MAELAPRPQVAPKAAVISKVATTPDFVAIAKKHEDEISKEIEDNPLFQMIITSTDDKEKQIEAVVAYLTEGLQKPKAKSIDARRQASYKFNAFVQMLRKQLGQEQAREITSKENANFQRILKETGIDVQAYEDQLGPLNKLATLWSEYGTTGNIIEKMNIARTQAEARGVALKKWQTEHTSRVGALETEISKLNSEIDSNKLDHEEKSHGLGSYFSGYSRAQIEIEIQRLTAERDERLSQLEAARAETPDEALKAQQGDIEPVDEGILALQDIGGEAFKKAVNDLRMNTEQALAKMSSSFDEAATGLQNTRDSFVKMDRNCTDATYALSVLEVAVKRAEEIARKIAKEKMEVPASQNADEGMAELDRMERENESELILSYTGTLNSFRNDINMAITSLRKGQTVIKNIIRMNGQAIEQCNTHKVIGIANMADSATITIGSIIDLCNRAASRALADGLNRMRGVTEEGNARLMGGTYEGLQQQNEQLEDLISSTTHLKDMMVDITVNSIELLKKQGSLYEQMSVESDKLAQTTTNSERSAFNARTGGGEIKKSDAPTTERPTGGFSLKRGGGNG